MGRHAPQSLPAPQADVTASTLAAPDAIVSPSPASARRRLDRDRRSRSLRDDSAGGLFVEVIEERIRPGLERADANLDRLAGRYHFLGAEVLALELGRLVTLVRDDQDEGGIGFDLDLVGLELAFLDQDGDLRGVRCERTARHHRP